MLSLSYCWKQMVARSQSWTQFDFEVTFNAVGTAQAMGVLEHLQQGLTLVSQGLGAHIAFAARGVGYGTTRAG